MSGYVLSSDAAQDIDDIWEHIATDSLDAADRVIDSLLKACRMLGEHSGAGHRREDLAEDRLLLFWPVGDFLILYRPETRPLQIVAVVRGSRDIPSLVNRRQL